MIEMAATASATTAASGSPTLLQKYNSYISTLNHRPLPFPSLSPFVHDNVTYNSQPLTLTAYSDFIHNDILSAPDLIFNADVLLATNDEGTKESGDGHVAARIKFRCTPNKEADFLGLGVRNERGKTVEFVEHVFYKFEAGKIREVWSLIDKYEVARQLKGE